LALRFTSVSLEERIYSMDEALIKTVEEAIDDLIEQGKPVNLDTVQQYLADQGLILDLNELEAAYWAAYH